MKAVVFLNGEYKYSQEFTDRLFDEETVLLCADGGANYAYKYSKRPSYGFSIIPLDEIIEKLTLKGFKYETFNFDAERKISRLVSNIITSDECKVIFEKGKMLVILRKH